MAGNFIFGWNYIFSGLLLYGFIDGQADFSVIVAYWNIDCFFWNLYPTFVPVESQGKS